MRICGVIFDVDGTLLDSMFIWDTIGETYLRSIGYEPREDLNDTFKNMSLHQAACYYQTEYGVTLSIKEIMAGVNAMLERYYRFEVPLKAGVKELLAQLQRSKVKLCIATATDRYLVEDAQMCIRDRVYIDAIHYSVREDGVIRKLAAYVILGLTLEGKKEVLSIQIGENESCLLYTSLVN